VHVYRRQSPQLRNYKARKGERGKTEERLRAREGGKERERRGLRGGEERDRE